MSLINFFNSGKLDGGERAGMTLMEERLSEEDDHFFKIKRRAGLYILNHFTRSEAKELFDILDLPINEMEKWKDALERAAMTPEPVVEQSDKKMDHSRPGEQNGSARATNVMVRAIRKDFDDHNYTTLSALGAKYGVSRHTIRRIGYRKGWLHVQEEKEKPQLSE